MEYVLWSRDSFVMITGDIGTGKTTLIQKMLDDAGPKIAVAKMHQTQLNEIEFVQALLDQFGVNPFGTESKVELLSMLNHFLKERYEQGETVVVVIDEAQNLSPRVLEEIRLLSGFDSNREKLLNIFLVGQPELRDTMFSPQMEQLFQRIRLRFHLEGLGFDEVRSYIHHRLAIASEGRFYPAPVGRKMMDYSVSSKPFVLPTELFPDHLMGHILEYTGGIPRLINTLCDTALLTAFANDKRQIDKVTIMEAVEELQWMPYVERSSYRKSQAASNRTPHSLQVIKNGVVVAVERIAKNRIVIGRSHFCDIKIDQRLVSGKHCELNLGPRGYAIKDSDSANGTRVNGAKIIADKSVELKDGDMFEVGSYAFKYHNAENADGDGVRHLSQASAATRK